MLLTTPFKYVTTIVVHGSTVDETIQVDANMTTDDNTNNDMNETAIEEIIDFNEDANTEPESIAQIVESTPKFCLEKRMSDPVDILRYYQSKILMGKKLDIEDISEGTEGDSNFVVIDRENVLIETAIEEISGFDNLRICLEVQFAGEVCFFSFVKLSF